MQFLQHIVVILTIKKVINEFYTIKAYLERKQMLNDAPLYGNVWSVMKILIYDQDFHDGSYITTTGEHRLTPACSWDMLLKCPTKLNNYLLYCQDYNGMLSILSIKCEASERIWALLGLHQQGRSKIVYILLSLFCELQLFFIDQTTFKIRKLWSSQLCAPTLWWNKPPF